MIQRIQTLYLGIVIILVGIVACGVELISFVDGDIRHTISSFGVTQYDAVTGDFLSTSHVPVYIGFFALIFLTFICLMSYKNLPKQFKLGRMVFYIYFLSFMSLFLMTSMGDSILDLEGAKREMGAGFYIFAAGFPFTFLANTGIKRDKNILASLDRLR